MLDLVLDRMAKFNVRLNPSKCSFGMTTVEFLGHMFGVHLSDKRVQGIKDLPIPMSVSAVRSFVGMVDYFRDFIPSLSSFLYPLIELTRTRKFGENGSTRVLINNFDPLILYTDASTREVEGVLMQMQGGRERPCVFVSHTLSEQATRWG